MKRKISLFIFFLTIFFLTNVSGNLPDFPVSVLLQKHSTKELTALKRGEILAGEKVTGRFAASENNLGILSVRFLNRFRDSNTDVFSFRLKQEGASDWYYQNTYLVDQFRSNDLFPFGFPKISNSAGKTYYFEIESLYGREGNAGELSLLPPVFVTKYKFSKADLLQNKKELLIFMVKKIAGYISIYEVLIAAVISLIPYFLSRLQILHPRGVPQAQHHPGGGVGRFINRVLPLFVFLVTLIIAGLFATYEIDPAHDGIMLKPAIDVVEGKMLFRETFTQYGAATTLIQAGAVALFGKYVVVLRLLTAFFYAAIAVFLYLILSRFIPKYLTVLSIFIWIAIAPYLYNIFMPWSSVYANFFQIASLYFVLIFLEKKQRRYVFFTGVLTAMTFWCRQPVGVFLFLAYILFFIYCFHTPGESLRATPGEFKAWKIDKVWLYFVHFLGGFLLINLFFLLWLWSNNALGDWYRQSIYTAFIFGRSFGGGYAAKKIVASLLPVSFHLYAVLWLILPVVLLVFLIITLGKIWIQKKLDTPQRKLLILLLVGFASWWQYYPISENWHFYYGAALSVGIMVVFIYRMSSILTDKISRLLFLLGMLYLVFMPVMQVRIGLAAFRLTADYVQIKSLKVFAGLKLLPSDADFFQELGVTLSRYFQSHPNVSIVTTIEPLYLTFKENAYNFHPIFVNWDFINTFVYPDYQQKFNEFVREKHPLIISKSTEVFDNYCQLNVTNHAFNAVAKIYSSSNSKFTVISGNRDKNSAVMIKITGGEDVIENIIVEEANPGKKVRRWSIVSIDNFDTATLTNGNLGTYFRKDDILSINIPAKLAEDAKLIVKILFARDGCYAEQEI